MEYKSLFERIEKDHPECFNRNSLIFGNITDNLQKRMYWQMNDIINELKSDTEGINTLQLALNGPRLIRACIDYKISHSDRQLEEIIKTLTNINLDIFRTSKVDADNLENVRRKIIGSRDAELLYTLNHQDRDKTSWISSNPSFSKVSSDRLQDYSLGGNILFIALGQGGIAPGMDVFLRYTHNLKTNNSLFYPVRFSKHKFNDKQPRLTKNEENYLKDSSDSRRIIIFDEDICSGSTINQATNYFQSLMKRNDIIPIVNCSN